MIYTHLQKHFLRLDVLKPASLWAAAPQSPGFEQIPTRVISPMGLGNVSAGLLGGQAITVGLIWKSGCKLANSAENICNDKDKFSPGDYFTGSLPVYWPS